MMEIKLCAAHARYNCFPCSGQTLEDTIRDDPDFRSCADCEHYSLVKIMISKEDGRVICPSCQKAIENRAINRAQADLFVSQPGLF
jgi:hypothetical protein